MACWVWCLNLFQACREADGGVHADRRCWGARRGNGCRLGEGESESTKGTRLGEEEGVMPRANLQHHVLRVCCTGGAEPQVSVEYAQVWISAGTAGAGGAHVVHEMSVKYWCGGGVKWVHESAGLASKPFRMRKGVVQTRASVSAVWESQ